MQTMTPRELVVYVAWLEQAPPDTMVYVQPREAISLGFILEPGMHIVASAGELTARALMSLVADGEVPMNNLV